MIISVSVILGACAFLDVSAAGESITAYYDLHEITKVEEMTAGNHYLLVLELEVEEGEALLGLPEGSAEVVFTKKRHD